MKELEVKILEVDVHHVEDKLKKLGAIYIKEGPVNALLFDSEKNPLGKGNVLRLRDDRGTIELTYKRKIKGEGVKANEEREIVVDNFDETRKILELLGYKVVEKIDKRRASYEITETLHERIYKVKFELDTITYPVKCPTFLEIEAERKDLVEKYVRALGYKMSETVDWNQVKVVDHYRKTSNHS